MKTPSYGWRVGDAGHTIFGPKTDKPSPETIATVRNPTYAPMLAVAPDMREALRDLLEWAEHMGGWDAPAWVRARAVYAKAAGRR